jgi:hypothetical protein
VLGLTHEQVISVWVGTSNAEEFHQVVKLTVDIATDGDGAFLQQLLVWSSLLPIVMSVDAHHWLDIGLLLKDFSCLGY